MGKTVWKNLVLFLALYHASFQELSADASYQNLAVTLGYNDIRLLVPGNILRPRLIPEGKSLLAVTMDCGRSCIMQDTCYGYNLYENETFFVCELLSDYLRRNKTRLYLIEHPRCSVWEKIDVGNAALITETTSNLSTTPRPHSNTDIIPNISSITTKILATSPPVEEFPSIISPTVPETTPIMCADVHPGCLGIFPNCYSCIKTCIDWMNRNDLLDPTEVYLWPDGDGPDSGPILTKCALDKTKLIDRFINLYNASERSYIMPFYDMNRLVKLQVYPRIEFIFGRRSNISADPVWDISQYSNVFIGPDGTLANLTFSNISGKSTVDIFNLQGQPMKPTPFVNVADDRYNCGSFWLLDPTNATYCPGGKLGMFGSAKKNGTQVTKTGIRVPTKPNDLTFSVLVMLAN